MKTTLKVLGAVAALALTHSAWSYTMADVGTVDTLLATADSMANSGQQTETNWVNAYLTSQSLPATTFNTKTETVSYYLVEGTTDTYAFQLQADPGYFVLKNATNWALFGNNASTDWGVFDLSDLLAASPDFSKWNLGKKGQMTISHVSEFGTSQVPEPGSLALLAAGLVGLTLSRRLANQR